MTSGCYAVVAYLSGPLAEFVQGLRSQLVPREAHVRPHLTLLAPRVLESPPEKLHSALQRICYKEPPLLARNTGGKLERVAIAGVGPVAGRGAAFGDLDRNGFVDVVMTVLGGRPVVLRNAGNTNHWLDIYLIGTHSNRDGFGAKVKVNGQYGYASSAGSYVSANDKTLHFGLGSAREATVEVRWPSGKTQAMEHVPADQVLKVKEP